VSAERDWKSIFTEVFSAPPSVIAATIFSSVYGDEYPSEIEPFSYITRSELALFVQRLNIDETSLLLDIACGRGGPGLWVASQTGSSVVGVDISPTAIADAAERAGRLGLARRSRYVTGDFSAIPLDDQTVDAVMCIDALIFATDKSVAIDEIARVLRPGGRFVATTWDYISQPMGRPPQVADHRELLALSGFDVLSYHEIPRWRENQVRVNNMMLEQVDAMAAEYGGEPEELRESLREMIASLDQTRRRVQFVASRTTMT
jgi:ubiquinone/menaquinone biosynthesis C-methylase UbiE